jgi:hypothetical protein
MGHDVHQRPCFIASLQAPALGDVHEAVLLASLLPRSSGKDAVYFVDVAAPFED